VFEMSASVCGVFDSRQLRFVLNSSVPVSTLTRMNSYELIRVSVCAPLVC